MQIWRKVTNEITRTCIHISCGLIPLAITLDSDHSETTRVDLNGHTNPNPQVCPLWDNNLLGGIGRKAGYTASVRNNCDCLDDGCSHLPTVATEQLYAHMVHLHGSKHD